MIRFEMNAMTLYGMRQDTSNDILVVSDASVAPYYCFFFLIRMHIFSKASCKCANFLGSRMPICLMVYDWYSVGNSSLLNSELCGYAMAVFDADAGSSNICLADVVLL